MELGTAEPLLETEKEVRRLRRPRSSSGGPHGGGGGDGGGEDGDDGRRFHELEREQPVDRDKTKFVAWFLLLVVMMTFGGMLGAYIVISTNGSAEWRPFELPLQTWISTALIIFSSITYHFAQSAIFNDQHERAKKMLMATAGLGGAFISSQLLVWLALVERGFYMRGNPYAGFFYILTAAHAVHVIGGIVALGAVLLRSWNETVFGPELRYRRNLARSVGWYWHFMGVLWIVLFVMLGFWK